MNIVNRVMIALLLIGIAGSAQAQTDRYKWAVSTNTLSWASLGTINFQGAVGMSQHISLEAGAAVNPWMANTSTSVEMKNQQYGGYIGAKYWPWYVYSGWWIGAKVQYKNFEQVGILTSGLVRGDALGAGVSAGYSFMIGPHFNLDCGLGVWGGSMINYEKYDKKNEKGAKLLESGSKGFFFIDNIVLAIIYIF